MRKIEFRGLSIRNEWVCGNLTVLTNDCFVSHDKGSYISNPGGSRPFAFWVSPETVSEYTGLKDKDGGKIFEGDILDDKYKWVVYFKKGSFIAGNQEGDDLLDYLIKHRDRAGVPIKVIGNIHQNPELLKQEKT